MRPVNALMLPDWTSLPSSMSTRWSRHALDLRQQVGRHHDRDAELPPDARDEVEHLVAAGRVEAVRRLVEKHQLRVVYQRLRELDALPHAGRVAAHLAVALLEEADEAQDLGGALARGLRGSPLTRAMCATNSVALMSSGRQSCSGM